LGSLVRQRIERPSRDGNSVGNLVVAFGTTVDRSTSDAAVHLRRNLKKAEDEEQSLGSRLVNQGLRGSLMVGGAECWKCFIRAGWVMSKHSVEDLKDHKYRKGT